MIIECGRVTIADPIAETDTMVTSRRVYGTFLSRRRKGSRIGDEWAPPTVVTADGDLWQAGPRGHEADRPNPVLNALEKRRRRH
ncbi:hypothetical protein DEO72_LG10g1724 [Vigna unguiculata]|uniref:Uncharacterized protein n=1 Tax=Vigna unguiculata TaxID=3917 RepID=A0A4D6NCK2_VIGUN|nr:hypothetical protein DEO72_LG10g1723 [Vigna unguiculata]QCE10494.1 hypothetical protein DEO72_LG10g1724 [Vigna unguiculata]